jgi:SH3-like domain-containing protein
LVFKKNSGWIHTSQLKKGKSFILLKNQILFSKPTKYSKPMLKISKGRLLLVKKCKKNWCKVKTENYLGWVITNNIWGTY